MILFFYNLVLLGALVASAPWWLWKMATTHKYRRGMAERLGRTRVFAGQNGRPLLWVHAVSVGEVLAVARLVRELEERLPHCFIAISTTTRTGQELAQKRFGAERVFYCPLDLPWATRSWIHALQPSLLILTETEFWPNLLAGCFRRRIPVAVVNARISDRSWPRYRRLRALWRPFLSRVDRFLAQSPLDAERLQLLCGEPDRVRLSGNLKFDIRAAEEAGVTRLLRAQLQGRRIVVAGSTLEGEESALLAAWPTLLAADPNLLLVLAPRHPERFSLVAALLGQSGIPWARRSAWTGAPLASGSILLLDTIGELASVYSLASVAFVGGSLIPSGGHNPLEPAQFAVPIVAGPSYENFRAITEDLLAHQGLRIATTETLAATLIEVLQTPALAQELGSRAKEIFDRQAGATARSIEAILELLPAQIREGRPR
jgi:3-deoxy-D-manno-octulosonic-acid transferase